MGVITHPHFYFKYKVNMKFKSIDHVKEEYVKARLGGYNNSIGLFCYEK